MEVLNRNTALQRMFIHRLLLALNEGGAISGSVVLEFDSTVLRKGLIIPPDETS